MLIDLLSCSKMYIFTLGLPPAKSKNSKNESKLSLEKYSTSYEPYLLYAVNRCLAYDPNTRFDNVDEFAAALLDGSNWDSLQDYELDVMNYDRFKESTRESQHSLTLAVA